MKLKIYILSLCAFVLFSCNTEDIDIYDVTNATDIDDATSEVVMQNRGKRSLVLPRVSDGQVLALGAEVFFAGKPKGSDISYSYEVVDPTDVDLAKLNISKSGTIKAGELISSMPIEVKLDEFEIGAPNTLTLRLTDASVPNVNKNDLTYTFSVVCPSNLAGSYSAVSVGQSTDDCCPDETTVEKDIEITGEDGSYTISDFSGGLYLEWYEVYGITPDFDLSRGFNDVCNQVSGSFSEPFNTDVTMTGSVDGSTGVITYTWVNGYDDTATVTLTPK